MADEGSHVVQLRDDFYRDDFAKVILLIAFVCVAVGLLVAVSTYLHMEKPKPVYFSTDKEWRVQASVPLDKPYLSTPDLLQWVSDAVRNAFVYDFNNYNNQLQASTQYFTSDGWKVFLNQLNIYVNYNTVQTNKMFVNPMPSGAPFILQQGLLSGRYAWWVQMPIDLNYISYDRSSKQTLTLQILVVRVPTMNNLSGVGIDNVIVSQSTTTSQEANG